MEDKPPSTDNKNKNKDWVIDPSCIAKAVEAIENATFLIIGAGAGMSADAGLAVYADVSKMDYFEKNNLTYRDVSDPRLLHSNPEVFLGWSGFNLRKYRNTQPHPGYSTLHRWAVERFTDTPHTQRLRKQISSNPLRTIDPKELAAEPAAESLPDCHFVFTTNVDGFFEKAGFAPHSLCQTHGAYERWQCSGLNRGGSPAFKLFDGPCTKKVWKVPPEYEMDIIDSEMKAPAGPARTPSSVKGWETNHPMCTYCGKLARPCVYQFGDNCFLANEAEEMNLANWCHAVAALAKTDPSVRVVMLELGVGMRLPKIRVHFERMLHDMPEGQGCIIRVNPEYSSHTLTEGLNEGRDILSIPAGALAVIEAIDKHLTHKE